MLVRCLTSLSFRILCGLWTLTPLQGLRIDVSAPSAILVRASDGRCLWGKAEEERRHPASLTKIATAWWILYQYGDRLDEIVTIPREALVTLSPEQRRKGKPWVLETGDLNIALKAGEQLSARTLLEGTLIRSAGDAANSLAWHFGGGSIEAFVEEMNQGLVEKLGLRNTHFMNPHGHIHPNHFSTVSDLAKIAVAASKYEEFRRIVASRIYLRPGTDLVPAQRLRSTNLLLSPGPFFHPHAQGMKTGYTSKAGACLIAAADDGTRSVIYVSLASRGPGRWLDAHKVIDVALQETPIFRTYHRGGLIGKGHPIVGGRHPVQGMVVDPLRIQRYASEERPVTMQIAWNARLQPPIVRDQVLGEVRVVDEGGHILIRAPLQAAADVDATWTYRLGHLWKHWGWAGNMALLSSLLIGLSVWIWALVYCQDHTSQRQPLVEG